MDIRMAEFGIAVNIGPTISMEIAEYEEIEPYKGEGNANTNGNTINLSIKSRRKEQKQEDNNCINWRTGNKNNYWNRWDKSFIT